MNPALLKQADADEWARANRSLELIKLWYDTIATPEERARLRRQSSCDYVFLSNKPEGVRVIYHDP
jgi:hypothetical protein